MTDLQDVGADPDILHAINTLMTLTQTKLEAAGATLGCMAVVWIAGEAEGNSASCLISNDPGPEAIEHMADCILGTTDKWDTLDVTPPMVS